MNHQEQPPRPARILFVPMLEKGHIHPLIGVAQRLQEGGHELACFGLQRDEIVAQLAAAGIRWSWFFAEGRGGRAASSPERSAFLTDPRKLLRWSAMGITASLETKNVEALRAAIVQFKPDVVCVDPMAYPGCVAAELEGVPWAAITPLMVAAADPAWRCPWIDVARELQPMVLARMSELGVSGVRMVTSDVVSPWLNTVFVTEDFAPRAWSQNRHSWYLGPSRPLGQRGDEAKFPWARLREDVPIVYVAAGGGQSLSFEPQVFRAVCGSLGADEAQFVCVLSELVDADWVRELPGSCIAVRYAPQVRLLERHVAVAVTHGGINTVTECLTHGRPMLVVPIGHEQFIQARAVERAGAGLTIDSADLTPQSCRAALLRLLEPQSAFQESAARVRRSHGVNGAVKAVELILTLARTKQPLPPPLDDRT